VKGIAPKQSKGVINVCFVLGFFVYSIESKGENVRYSNEKGTWKLYYFVEFLSFYCRL